MNYYQNPLFVNYTRGYVKKYFSKPLTLVTAIITLAGLIISLIYSFLVIGDLVNTILNSGAITGGNLESFDIEAFSETLPSSMPSVSLTSILMVIALFLLYFQSKSSNYNTTPKASFIILRVIAIFGIISTILVGVVVSLILGFLAVLVFSGGGQFESWLYSDNFHGMSFMSEYSQFPESEAFDQAVWGIVLIVVLVILIAVIGFLLWYYSSLNKYAKSLKSSLEEPYLNAKGARAFGLLNIIFGIITFVATLFMLFKSDTVVSFMPLQLASSFVSTVSQILFGVLSFNYASFAKKANKELSQFYYQQSMYGYAPMQNNMPYQYPPMQESTPFTTPVPTPPSREEYPEL